MTSGVCLCKLQVVRSLTHSLHSAACHRMLITITWRSGHVCKTCNCLLIACPASTRRRPSKPAFTCAHRHENYGLTTPTHRCPVAVVHCSCGRGAVYIVRRDPICPITLAGRKVCPDNGQTHTHTNMCRRRLWRGRHTQTQTDRPAAVGQLNRWNRNDY